MKRCKRQESGQSSVEFALILPVLALLMLMLVQSGLVVSDQILLVHAAREAAREAAVDQSFKDVRSAALEGSHLDGRRLDLKLHRHPSSKTVTAALVYRPSRIPLAGVFLRNVQLRSRATMRIESATVTSLPER